MEPHGRRSNDLACEALTARGEPCRAFGSDVVDLGDAGVRRLCGYHGHMAKHRPIGLWDRPIKPAELTPESTTMPRWSAADDALLLAHADEPAAAVAFLLNRTTQAVWQRRSRLRRVGRG